MARRNASLNRLRGDLGKSLHPLATVKNEIGEGHNLTRSINSSQKRLSDRYIELFTGLVEMLQELYYVGHKRDEVIWDLCTSGEFIVKISVPTPLC
ncbi:hypothetical protein AMTR_s00016p00109010 [Amborella trichopoda]|uniref:Uncharacterized protein n=1 Tax=Amborella trichopoda TaxID=13333 RepID=W1P8H1_AMBTC|nr:hypothetical protein AMTR_s00016p00109010 [Amborella trichopoda]